MRKFLLGLLLLTMTSCEPGLNEKSVNDLYVKKIERSERNKDYIFYYIGPKEGDLFYFRIFSTNQKINLGDKVDIIISKENGEIIRF